ncbi:enoyl-CoA hydratase/isomerase family protein [Allokutzneria sp. NRRL B-24872]|uniref:enoyl-CoA hydratase/isomerase family protein n=1 Tax=Allokutzneria sp. NRRL B-24872 TaxID=1137961 RepID=UPI000A3CFF1D|nr:enoyl-CoA hydratase/isomerase family protein [Allokutzneria sp. NRRL B-24872]
MTVRSEVLDGVALIHLDRPHRLNAVTDALSIDLAKALRAAEGKAVAVVIAGVGRAFCSGHDLREPLPEEDVLAVRARVERIQEVTRAIREFSGPVIAAVHGYALGAGFEFALGCDLVVAARDAIFGFPEVEVGLSVTGAVSRLLPLLVGPLRAKELLLLGERITAERAADLGMVNRLVEPGEHEKVALELAGRFRDRPKLSVALAKRAVDRGIDQSVAEAMATEVDHAVLTAGTDHG